jgi:hypothetical protein
MDSNHPSATLLLFDVPAHQGKAEVKRRRHVHGVSSSQGKLGGQVGCRHGQTLIHGDEPEARQVQERLDGSCPETDRMLSLCGYNCRYTIPRRCRRAAVLAPVLAEC